MNEKQVTLPTIGLIAGTRVALGIGIGLLLAERLTPEQRRAAGLALLAFGALTTIPLVAEVLGADRSQDADMQRIQQNPVGPYVAAAREGVAP